VKSSKTSPAPANKTDRKVDLYDRLIATIPGIERKGDANPYTSLNGNMFTLLQGSRSLAIRLPEDKRAEFLMKHKTALFEAYGAVMKEYVAVPDALLKNKKELQKYLEFSYEYVKTLKPKPTKKQKKA
jgi:TfoX/Sxy family transcriptional regulator of competence genes